MPVLIPSTPSSQPLVIRNDGIINQRRCEVDYPVSLEGIFSFGENMQFQGHFLVWTGDHSEVAKKRKSAVPPP
jgi:hypothetical protein